MVLTTVLSMMRYVGEIEDRDFVDRLHSYITTNLLIGLSVLVSFKQFGGSPLECLTPDIFSGSWEEYAEKFCWAQDTYFVPPHSVVDGMPQQERSDRRISYYQWVPFFLLLEAGCFRLPSLFWKYMSGHSGIKISEIVKLSKDPNNIKPDIRRTNIKSLTTHLQGALRFHRRLFRKQIRPHNLLCFLNLPYSASFVTSMYILTKLTYLLNVGIQLLLMNNFLGTDKYSLYGIGALVDFLNGSTWQQSGMFPRVSLCDFDVRVMGNVQEYTIQCVLVINIFNEKIFVFLWFWYCFLLLFSFGSFCFWLIVFLLPFPNRRFINRHLEMSELAFDVEANKKMVHRFIDSYLRNDGVFVIRMLTMHSGVIFSTELVLSLWQSYYGVNGQLKRCNSFPEGDFSPIQVNRARTLDDERDMEFGRTHHLEGNDQPFSSIRNKTTFIKPFYLKTERIATPPSKPPENVLRAVATPKMSTSESINSALKVPETEKMMEMSKKSVKSNNQSQQKGSNKNFELKNLDAKKPLLRKSAAKERKRSSNEQINFVLNDSD